MFENIIGYDYIKEELRTIISWYKNSEFIKNENANLPSGILFYGNPGNGKTFFIKELKKQFNDNAFVISGDSENILKEISDVYASAREKELAIVLVDEIDLLISDNKKIARIFQDELDGINKSKSRVLTIASTNHYYDLPDALLRSGRFDRVINVNDPNSDDRKKILINYFEKLNIKTSFSDFDNVTDYLRGLSCAEIMTLCNDCYFRFYGDVIDEDKIRESFSKIDKEGTSINNDKRTIEMAYHEIGHALLVLKYKKEYSIKEVKFVNKGGICRYSKIEDSFDGYNSAIHNIEIGLGGIAVERLLYKDISFGSEDDLAQVRKEIDYIISRIPKRIDLVLHKYDRYKREKTEKTKYKNEKISNKLLKKCYKNAYRYLRKHKKEIIKYGKMLFEKGFLLKEDLKGC